MTPLISRGVLMGHIYISKQSFGCSSAARDLSHCPSQTGQRPLHLDMQDNKEISMPQMQDEHDREKASLHSMDKASPVLPADDIPKTRPETWPFLERITYFLTRYGIETNGYDCLNMVTQSPNSHLIFS